MPAYPQLQEHKPGDQIDLSKVDYPLTERVSSAASNEYAHMIFNNKMDLAPPRGNAASKNPGMQPVTQEDIDNWKVGRPDLPNIPIGAPKYVGESVVSLHDNDKNLSMMAEAPAGILGTIAAFGGSSGASLLDLKSDVVGVATGGLSSMGLKTIANAGVRDIASKSIFGSAKAKVGTWISELMAGNRYVSKAIESGTAAAGFGAGYQANVEASSQRGKTKLEQPHEYMQSLQNIGVSGISNFLLGGALSFGASGLLGRKVMRFEDGSFIDAEPNAKSGVYVEPDFVVSPDGKTFATAGATKPWTASREGGLFNRSEFSSYSPKEKAIVAQGFKVVTKDADITMNEEATGQMYNGQMPNIDLIMKQGVHDAGETFREHLRTNNIDADKLDAALKEAGGNMVDQLGEHLKTREALDVAEKALAKAEDASITENKDLSQAGILKLYKQAQYNKSFLEGAPEHIPDNLQKHMEVQQQIDKLQAKVDETPGEPNKQVMRRIAALKKSQPKVLTPKQELKAIKSDLAKVNPKDYAENKSYQRLTELAKVWKTANTMLEHMQLKDLHDAQIKELSEHLANVKVMRDHIADAHEPVTGTEVKEYSEHLKTPGIPDNGFKIEPSENLKTADVDKLLSEIPKEQIEAAEGESAISNKAYNEELAKQVKRYKSLDTTKKMIEQMTDCLLKESV